MSIIEDHEWKVAGGVQSQMGNGVRDGVKILVAGFDELLVRDENDIATNQDARLLLMKASDEIIAGLRLIKAKRDPATAIAADKCVESLVSLFPSPAIYVKRIRNGYWGDNDPWALRSPWLIVTTVRGPVTIGWRKHVIQIDWTDSDVESDADKLFPGENVTKGSWMIHAHSEDDAKRYLSIILASK